MKVEKAEKDFILDTMRWSFSRATAFQQCKLEWYQNYIECSDKQSNFFAEVGSLVHSILQRYFEGKLDFFDLVSTFDREWSNVVVTDAPYTKGGDLAEKYYWEIRDYFENFQPINEERYTVLGVEKEVRTMIGGHEVVGFIDLLLLDKLDGKIIIVDHKSANIKFLKNGNVSKSNEQQVQKFKRQLYIYAKGIRSEYPDLKIKELQWNLFREQKTLKINYDDQEAQETVRWFEDIIKSIYDETEFAPSKDDYYCRNLCSFRHSCLYSPNFEKYDTFWERNEDFGGDGVPDISW